MSKRKKVAIDAIVDELGAVAAFARSSPAPADGGSHDGHGQALLAGLLLTPTAAPVNERRMLAGGKYQVAVGWDAEPAIEGQKNAATIRILRADTNPVQPVEGAEETLKVRIRQGAESRESPLRKVFGQGGYYVAPFVPTRAGHYAFNFAGTLEGEPVDELFDSAAGRFGAVEPAADVQFPLCLGGPGQVAAAVREAQGGAENAWVLATISLGVGFVGLLGVLTTRRTRSDRNVPPPAASAAEPRAGRERQPVDLAEGGPIQPEPGERAALESLGEVFGQALKQEITQALEPVLLRFRQQIAQTVREQTDLAVRSTQMPRGGHPASS
jgi:hypothetical protein